MAKKRQYRNWISVGLAILSPFVSIYFGRSQIILDFVIAAATAWYLYVAYTTDWISRADNIFGMVTRIFVATLGISLVGWGSYIEVSCYSNDNDPRRDATFDDITIDMTFHIPDKLSRQILGNASEAEIMKKLFCLSDRMHFEVVLIPGNNPETLSPVNLIIEAVNPLQPCDLRSFIAALDSNKTDQRIDTKVSVAAHDSTSVTLEAHLYGYVLENTLHTRERFKLSDYGRPLPMYEAINNKPIPAGNIEFLPPMVSPSTPRPGGQMASPIL
jgi:hypothetical protein